LDADLFGGMISSLNSFIKHLGEKEFKHINMDTSQIFIERCEKTKLFFIARSNRKREFFNSFDFRN